MGVLVVIVDTLVTHKIKVRELRSFGLEVKDAVAGDFMDSFAHRPAV